MVKHARNGRWGLRGGASLAALLIAASFFSQGAAGCGSSGASGAPAGGAQGAGGNSGATGSGSQSSGDIDVGGGIELGDGGIFGSGTGGIDPDAACATSSSAAELTPVNMLIMFDKSGSMNKDGKWDNATTALLAFFKDPGTAGLRVALRFFPDAGCTDTSCDIKICGQPLVNLGPLTADAAPTDAQEKLLISAVKSKTPGTDGGTPIFAALAGAEEWAADNQAKSPKEKTVVVLVTDGAPNGCGNDIAQIAQIAQDARDGSGVLTYAIGLVGSNQTDMDTIAEAGGTTQGFFIGNGNATGDLLAALKAIQGSQLACEFAMPSSHEGASVDPNLVNVNYTPGDGGAVVTLGQVKDVASCSGQAGGWYYDDPSKPAKLTFCASTCSAVQADPQAKIEILLGCATKPAN